VPDDSYYLVRPTRRQSDAGTQVELVGEAESVAEQRLVVAVVATAVGRRAVGQGIHLVAHPALLVEPVAQSGK
jgi:hypothetical protein